MPAKSGYFDYQIHDMKTKCPVCVTLVLVLVINAHAQLKSDSKALMDSMILNAKRYSVYTASVNWDTLQAIALSDESKSMKATFGHFISVLGDNQAVIFDKKRGEVIAQYPQYADAELPSVMENAFEAKALDNNVRYVRLRSYFKGDDVMKESALIRAAIDTLSKGDASKWIIDLRGVSGNEFRIAMAGIGPLLGEGLIASEIDSKEAIHKMFEIHNGRLYEDQHLAAHFVCPADLSKSAIAVLIDETTKDAGEVIALALRGRKQARLFGASTSGNVKLAREINLTGDLVFRFSSGYYQDRRGSIYKDAVHPHVKVNASQRGPADAVISAALDWLNISNNTVIAAK